MNEQFGCFVQSERVARENESKNQRNRTFTASETEEESKSKQRQRKRKNWLSKMMKCNVCVCVCVLSVAMGPMNVARGSGIEIESSNIRLECCELKIQHKNEGSLWRGGGVRGKREAALHRSAQTKQTSEMATRRELF